MQPASVAVIIAEGWHMVKGQQPRSSGDPVCLVYLSSHSRRMMDNRTQGAHTNYHSHFSEMSGLRIGNKKGVFLLQERQSIVTILQMFMHREDYAGAHDDLKV
jgi:hypothetical protein